MMESIATDVRPLPVEADLSMGRFVSEYANPCRPVVFANPMPNWAAWSRWTFDFFREHYGGRRVPILRGDQPKECKRDYPLAEVLDLIESAEEGSMAPYVMALDIIRYFPELVSDVQPHLQYALPDRMASKLLPKGWPYRNQLIEVFIGGVGSGTPPHLDPHFIHAFVLQMVGDKEITMVAPDDVKHLYPGDDYFENLLPATYDMRGLDPALYPNAHRATFYRGVVGPGQGVFIPAGWLHCVKILSPSISFGTNNVGRSNWESFCNDVAKDHHTGLHKTVAKKAMRAYLRVVGAYIDRAYRD